MTPPAAHHVPTIGAIGLVGWDHVVEVARYPALGGYAVVTETFEAIGGTTANSAAAARRLGAAVHLIGLVGDDPSGQATREALVAIGVDASEVRVDPVRPTDASTVVVDRGTGERSILWHQGARVAKGSRVDVDRLFGGEIAILDTDDVPLRRFLSDLPAHTRPRARLLGPLTYLADAGPPDAIEIALRHDIVVGNEREFRELTGLADAESALADLRGRLRGSNARVLVMTRGADGATAATVDDLVHAPGHRVACRDATGAGDAFVGGLAFALGCRWPLRRALALANAVGAMATTALGSQAGQPDLAAACALAGIDADRPETA